jgi:hypothetical protein
MNIGALGIILQPLLGENSFGSNCRSAASRKSAVRDRSPSTERFAYSQRSIRIVFLSICSPQYLASRAIERSATDLITRRDPYFGNSWSPAFRTTFALNPPAAAPRAAREHRALRPEYQ